MYRQVLVQFGRNWRFLLCASILLTTMATGMRLSPSWDGTAAGALLHLVWVFVVLHVLASLNETPLSPAASRSAAWRFLGIVGGLMALGVVVLLFMAALALAALPKTRDVSMDVLMLAPIVVTLTFMAIVLAGMASFAPAFAAITTGDRTPFWHVVRTRGRRQFPLSFKEIVLSVGPLQVLNSVAYGVFVGAPDLAGPAVGGRPTWPGVLGLLVFNLVQAYLTGLLAVAMHRSYARDLAIEPVGPCFAPR